MHTRAKLRDPASQARLVCETTEWLLHAERLTVQPGSNAGSEDETSCREMSAEFRGWQSRLERLLPVASGSRRFSNFYPSGKAKRFSVLLFSKVGRDRNKHRGRSC